jgi:hypothetical protein
VSAVSQFFRAADRRIDRIADALADRLDAFNHSVDPVRGAATDPALQAEVDGLLGPALARNLDRVQREFVENDEYVCVAEALPPQLVGRIRQEVIVDRATRSVVPWYRSAGSIGYRRIQVESPFTAAVYRSRAMRDYVSALCGKPVQCKSDDDDHACTFYVYSKPGDRMSFHYDVCGCEDAASYSMIIGVIDDSTQKLLVELHRGSRLRSARSLAVSTSPGLMITFAGSKVWHGVSRLGRDELRVTLGLAYATNDRQPSKRRLVKVTADALFHFGLGAALKRRARARIEQKSD